MYFISHRVDPGVQVSVDLLDGIADRDDQRAGRTASGRSCRPHPRLARCRVGPVAGLALESLRPFNMESVKSLAARYDIAFGDGGCGLVGRGCAAAPV